MMASSERRAGYGRVWAAIATGCGACFGAVLAVVESGQLAGEDRSLELAVHHAFGPGDYRFFEAVSDIGSGVIRTGLILLITVALLAARRWGGMVLFLTAIGGALLLDTLAKLAVARPRPHLFPQPVSAAGYSFPSGHAANTLALSFILVYLLWQITRSRRITIVGAIFAAGIAIMVGLSRIVLGVHYPSDVLGGFLLGSAWVALVIALFQRVGHLSRSDEGWSVHEYPG
jgi:membrane-associated phospholipid phosphatase